MSRCKRCKLGVSVGSVDVDHCNAIVALQLALETAERETTRLAHEVLALRHALTIKGADDGS